ncbi:phosphoribosylaminoimidazolesuccinocarboxamide synthase [Streptomyces chiangmaiensis]
MMPVLNSTKNLHVVEPPTATREGVGIFEYTDHYTVFHYGRMPAPIPGKGEAICRMAVVNFTMLEEAGVRTHFRRFIAPNRIEFTLARLPDLAARPSPRAAATISSPSRSSSATSCHREAPSTGGWPPVT